MATAVTSAVAAAVGHVKCELVGTVLKEQVFYRRSVLASSAAKECTVKGATKIVSLLGE